MKKWIKISLCMLVLLLSGCGNNKSEEQVDVVTTIGPLAAIVKQIAPELKVDTLLDKGSDYHHFEPSASDIKKVNDAKYFICVSESVEPFVESIIANKTSNLEVIQLGALEPFKTQEHDLYQGEAHTHYHDEKETDDHTKEEDHDHESDDLKDPHFWFSPKANIAAMESIKNELEVKGVSINQDNYDAALAKLEEYNTQYQEFVNIDQKTIITNHDAYRYLKDDYGLNTASIYGGDEHDEPSSAHIKELVDLINQQQIKAIFISPGENASINNSIVEQTRVKSVEIPTGLDIDTMDGLYQDLEKTLNGFKEV